MLVSALFSYIHWDTMLVSAMYSDIRLGLMVVIAMYMYHGVQWVTVEVSRTLSRKQMDAILFKSEKDRQFLGT